MTICVVYYLCCTAIYINYNAIYHQVYLLLEMEKSVLMCNEVFSLFLPFAFTRTFDILQTLNFCLAFGRYRLFSAHKATGLTCNYTSIHNCWGTLNSHQSLHLKMQNQDGNPAESKPETIASVYPSEADDWENFRDDDIMLQHSAIQAEEAVKIPFVGDKARIIPLYSCGCINLVVFGW